MVGLLRPANKLLFMAGLPPISAKMSQNGGSNPGSNPFFSLRGGVLRVSGWRGAPTAAQRRFRRNFRPQNHVFTPHFLSEITSVRVVYGVNRNLLIEICPKPPSPQHPPLVVHPLITPPLLRLHFCSFIPVTLRGVSPPRVRRLA